MDRKATKTEGRIVCIEPNCNKYVAAYSKHLSCFECTTTIRGGYPCEPPDVCNLCKEAFKTDPKFRRLMAKGKRDRDSGKEKTKQRKTLTMGNETPSAKTETNASSPRAKAFITKSTKAKTLMDVSWYSAASLAEIEKIIQAEMTRKKSNEEVCRIEQQRQETGLKRDASDEGENCFDQQFCAVEKKIKQILSQVEKVKNNERERSDLLKELVNLSSNQLFDLHRPKMLTSDSSQAFSKPETHIMEASVSFAERSDTIAQFQPGLSFEKRKLVAPPPEPN